MIFFGSLGRFFANSIYNIKYSQFLEFNLNYIKFILSDSEYLKIFLDYHFFNDGKSVNISNQTYPNRNQQALIEIKRVQKLKKILKIINSLDKNVLKIYRAKLLVDKGSEFLMKEDYLASINFTDKEKILVFFIDHILDENQNIHLNKLKFIFENNTFAKQHTTDKTLVISYLFDENLIKFSDIQNWIDIFEIYPKKFLIFWNCLLPISDKAQIIQKKISSLGSYELIKNNYFDSKIFYTFIEYFKSFISEESIGSDKILKITLIIFYLYKNEINNPSTFDLIINLRNNIFVEEKVIEEIMSVFNSEIRITTIFSPFTTQINNNKTYLKEGHIKWHSKLLNKNHIIKNITFSMSFSDFATLFLLNIEKSINANLMEVKFNKDELSEKIKDNYGSEKLIAESINIKSLNFKEENNINNDSFSKYIFYRGWVVQKEYIDNYKKVYNLINENLIDRTLSFEDIQYFILISYLPICKGIDGDILNQNRIEHFNVTQKYKKELIITLNKIFTIAKLNENIDFSDNFYEKIYSWDEVLSFKFLPQTLKQKKAIEYYSKYGINFSEITEFGLNNLNFVTGILKIKPSLINEAVTTNLIKVIESESEKKLFLDECYECISRINNLKTLDYFEKEIILNVEYYHKYFNNFIYENEKIMQSIIYKYGLNELSKLPGFLKNIDSNIFNSIELLESNKKELKHISTRKISIFSQNPNFLELIYNDGYIDRIFYLRNLNFPIIQTAELLNSTSSEEELIKYFDDIIEHSRINIESILILLNIDVLNKLANRIKYHGISNYINPIKTKVLNNLFGEKLVTNVSIDKNNFRNYFELIFKQKLSDLNLKGYFNKTELNDLFFIKITDEKLNSDNLFYSFEFYLFFAQNGIFKVHKFQEDTISCDSLILICEQVDSSDFKLIFLNFNNTFIDKTKIQNNDEVSEYDTNLLNIIIR